MANNNNSNSEHLVPSATPALENLKQQIVAQVGIAGHKVNPAEYNQALDQVKYEVATEIGVPLQQGYNGNLTAKQTGAIGGRMGGHIGGQMVKHLIEIAEGRLTGH